MARPPHIPPDAAGQVAERIAKSLAYLLRLRERLLLRGHDPQGQLVREVTSAIDMVHRVRVTWHYLSLPPGQAGDPLLPAEHPFGSRP